MSIKASVATKPDLNSFRSPLTFVLWTAMTLIAAFLCCFSRVQVPSGVKALLFLKELL